MWQNLSISWSLPSSQGGVKKSTVWNLQHKSPVRVTNETHECWMKLLSLLLTHQKPGIYLIHWMFPQREWRWNPRGFSGMLPILGAWGDDESHTKQTPEASHAERSLTLSLPRDCTWTCEPRRGPVFCNKQTKSAPHNIHKIPHTHIRFWRAPISTLCNKYVCCLETQTATEWKKRESGAVAWLDRTDI